MNYQLLSGSLGGTTYNIQLFYPKNLTVGSFTSSNNNAYTSPFYATTSVPKSGITYLVTVNAVYNSNGVSPEITSISSGNYSLIASYSTYTTFGYKWCLYKINSSAGATVTYGGNFYTRGGGHYWIS